MAVDPNSPYQTGPNASDLWLRKWSLTLKGPTGDLTLSQSNSNPEADGLRITFRTQQTHVSGQGLPGQAIIMIFNAKPATQIMALTREFNRCILAAGYQNGRYGVIFDGIISYFEHGREETLTDTYLKLHLQDGDIALNWATINQTLSAGHSVHDVAQAVAKQMEAKGVTIGSITGVPTTPMPRGMVLYGKAKNVLDEYGLSYFVQNGRLTIYDPRSPTPTSSEIKLLNSMTGLVGMPRATANGVEATMLLDPALPLLSLVKINQKDINAVAPGFERNAQGEFVRTPQTSGAVTVQQGYSPTFFADTTADGTYEVFVIEHEGDSRGNPWYTHIIGYAAGEPFNPTAARTVLQQYGIGPTDGQIAAANKPQSVPDIVPGVGG